ncbi:MAG: hypothetical protein FJ291_28625 [Planctomycetes bacterium]|nr:hypothetical protein [Planctomycetota bacterium]
MKWLPAVAALAAIAFCGCGEKAGGRHYERAGGFSYDPPQGWQIVEWPGLKYRVSLGPREKDFTPNINIVDQPYPGSLAEYVEADTATARKLSPEIKGLGRAAFRTDHGVAGWRIIAESEMEGRRLRQTFYYFGDGERKYVVTCTALAEGGEALDPVFEQSMRTFRFH